jgi:hypothetical protein
MARNKRKKPRLELALYSRPKHPSSYHYALFISPKYKKPLTPEPVTKHHVKNTLQNINGVVSQPWRYERLHIEDVQREDRLLARIVIAKLLVSVKDVEEILKEIRMRQFDDVEPGREFEAFSCVTWVRDVVEELGKRGAVKGISGWESVKAVAGDYVGMKKGMGRWDVGWRGGMRVPMLDLLTGVEIPGG